MKTLHHNTIQIDIDDPNNINFSNDFDRQLYELMYNQIRSGSTYLPVIDTDQFYNGTINFPLVAAFKEAGLNLSKQPTGKASNPQRLLTKFIVANFAERYPLFLGLFGNCVFSAEMCIKNAELLIGASVNSTNFIEIKGTIDQINRGLWSRTKDVSESQSGVSTLGTISENLLNLVFDALVDNAKFFKVNQSDVQSYGDFVLMCLPNNLWISVKSNFARERLLASGYTNDILGVGFFQEAREFTSTIRIRNFQRAGFLAMYCPDIPVSEAQLANNENTYTQVMDTYRANGINSPVNINGMPFIRRLSELRDDLVALLAEPDIRRRTTVKF